MAYSINWINCEFTEENIWHNIKMIDPYYKLDIMAMIMGSYYKFHGQNTNPRILELELRKNNLNTGLIAIDWKSDPHYVKLFNEGKCHFVKKKYQYMYKNNSMQNVDQEHLADYVVIISCRSRKDVMTETLMHHSSMEENLEKLEEAGEIVLRTNDQNEMNDCLLATDIKIDDSDVNHHIQNGTKLLQITKFSLEDIFVQCTGQYPDAMSVPTWHRGKPTTMLARGNRVVCQVGIDILTNEYILL